jgi:hypothetical protein
MSIASRRATKIWTGGERFTGITRVLIALRSSPRKSEAFKPMIDVKVVSVGKTGDSGTEWSLWLQNWGLQWWKWLMVRVGVDATVPRCHHTTAAYGQPPCLLCHCCHHHFFETKYGETLAQKGSYINQIGISAFLLFRTSLGTKLLVSVQRTGSLVLVLKKCYFIPFVLVKIIFDFFCAQTNGGCFCW